MDAAVKFDYDRMQQAARNRIHERMAAATYLVGSAACLSAAPMSRWAKRCS